MLKPCPFCGSTVIRSNYTGGFKMKAYTECVTCGCTQGKKFDTMMDAEESWNNRKKIFENEENNLTQ